MQNPNPPSRISGFEMYPLVMRLTIDISLRRTQHIPLPLRSISPVRSTSYVNIISQPLLNAGFSTQSLFWLPGSAGWLSSLL